MYQLLYVQLFVWSRILIVIDDVESDEEVDVDKDKWSRSNAVYVQLAKLSFFVVEEKNVGSSKNGKC